jgi:two-component system chemotaxis response regulator CheB
VCIGDPPQPPADARYGATMTRDRFPIVALVCSAGGLDALQQVLATLPGDFPAAVIILQHLDPHAHSLLPRLLGRHSALPVSTAEDGDPLMPGRVIVAPPGRHTLVTGDGRIALILSGALPPYRPSADLLLTSLALAAGERAIAVVLTGYGRDGATGATAVHRFGGVVIATDADTSTQFEMPEATIGRHSITDHVVPLPEVGDLLTELVRR